ncbi:RHS repeat-associated core domain-containing protein [Nakamurella sp. A5-74]|uniref:RHS repeat-associated core domain-containing protein n=1 Tax=Nakamurella sp. A5-74 TaxID=3158264 RepID=A0AAU8DVJ4_9ACTN
MSSLGVSMIQIDAAAAPFTVSSPAVGVQAAPSDEGVWDPSEPTAPPWTTGTSNQSPSTPAARSAVVEAPAGNGDEVVSLRTATSNTYAEGDRLRTEISPVPVNFKDAGGAWQPVDEALVPVGGVAGRGVTPSLTNAADAHDVVLPPTAGLPVSVVKGALTVTSQLAGAVPVTVSAEDDTAVYRGVFPGVDQVYVSRSGALEQYFRLSGKDARSTFTQSLTLPAGYTLAAVEGGSAEIRGAAGAVAAIIPAPAVFDGSKDPINSFSTDAVKLQITGAAPTWTVTTVVDPTWLQDAKRVFPVLVDPTVSVGLSGAVGCYVSAASTGSRTCSTSTSSDLPLTYGSTDAARRIFLKFPELGSASSPIPVDAQISRADLTMTVRNATNSTPIPTNVNQVAGTWDQSTVSWTNQPAITTPITRPVVTPSGTMTFSLVPVVQKWTSGQLNSSNAPTPVANNGIRIAATSESPASNTISFYGLASPDRPTLTVEWLPRVGQQKAVGMYDHRLSDRMDMHVSYGTRNLVINGTDVSWKSPGMAMSVRRTYNSLLAKNGVAGAFGLGWSMNGGFDVRLDLSGSGATFMQPGGARVFFRRNPDYPLPTTAGAYVATENGLDADLVQKTGTPTQYEMTFHKSKVVYLFTVDPAQPSTAYLSRMFDRANGNAVENNTATWGAPDRVPSSIVDTTGQRSVSFTNVDSTQGRVTAIAENLAYGASGARTYGYAYDTDKHLTTFTDPAGKVTRFCYTGDLITRIITPRGSDAGVVCATTGSSASNTTDIAYDTGGKVTTVTYRNGASPAITVAFAQTSTLDTTPNGNKAITTFTDPYGTPTEYTYDARDRVIQTRLNRDGLEVISKTAFNTNGDVTSSTSPVNAATTGDGSATTNTYDPIGNNLTGSATPTGASVALEYNDPQQGYQPSAISDDRDSGVTGQAKTTIDYGDGGTISSTSKGSRTLRSYYQGDSGIANCGPSGTAAYPKALCEERDGEYGSTASTQHRTLYRYNSLGELVTVVPPVPANGRATQANRTFTYDGFSRTKTSTNSRGQTTSFDYDAMDRLTRQTYAGGSYTEFAYDPDGNLLSRTDKNSSGTVTASQTNGYDALNRQTSEKPDNGNTNTVTWDANSRMATFTDDSGTTTYGYRWDGALTSITQPGGNCINFNIINRPTQGSNCILLQVDYSGQRLTEMYPGGIQLRRERDKSARVARMIGTIKDPSSSTTDVVMDQLYKYDTATKADTSRMTSRIDTVNNRNTTYDYTSEGWLKTVFNTVQSTGATAGKNTFCYDNNGNRTFFSTSTAATVSCGTNSTWDGANQQLTGPTGTAADYTFDDDGNETASGTSLAGALTRTSGWGDRGQNTSNTLGTGTTLLNTYIGSGNASPRSKTISSTDTQSFRVSMLGITEVSNSAGQKTFVQRDPSGMILGFTTQSGEHYYPMYDNLGSIWRVYRFDRTTAQVVSLYQPWGQPTTSQAPTFLQPFGYTGAYTNPTTGLVHLQNRYYDPTLGRFTQTDPSGQEDNPYTYTDNDPINRTDPNGLDWFEAAAIGIVAGLVGIATGGLALGAAAVVTAVDVGAAAVVGGGAAVGAGGVTAAVIDGGQDDWEQPAADYYS